jgi:hypothetical protein
MRTIFPVICILFLASAVSRAQPAVNSIPALPLANPLVTDVIPFTHGYTGSPTETGVLRNATINSLLGLVPGSLTGQSLAIGGSFTAPLLGGL